MTTTRSFAGTSNVCPPLYSTSTHIRDCLIANVPRSCSKAHSFYHPPYDLFSKSSNAHFLTLVRIRVYMCVWESGVYWEWQICYSWMRKLAGLLLPLHFSLCLCFAICSIVVFAPISKMGSIAIVGFQHKTLWKWPGNGSGTIFG